MDYAVASIDKILLLWIFLGLCKSCCLQIGRQKTEGKLQQNATKSLVSRVCKCLDGHWALPIYQSQNVRLLCRLLRSQTKKLLEGNTLYFKAHHRGSARWSFWVAHFYEFHCQPKREDQYWDFVRHQAIEDSVYAAACSSLRVIVVSIYVISEISFCLQ